MGTAEIRSLKSVKQKQKNTFADFWITTKEKLGLTEVGVIHGLPGRQPGLVVVAQQLVEEIQSLRADEVLVLTVDEPLPPLTRVPEIKTHIRDRTSHEDLAGGI